MRNWNSQTMMGVAGRWLERTEDQFQVPSCELQVKKPNETGLGSRKIKTKRFSIRRGEPWSNSIRIPTRSFVGRTELGVFGVTIRCHPGLDPGSVPRTNNLWKGTDSIFLIRFTQVFQINPWIFPKLIFFYAKLIIWGRAIMQDKIPCRTITGWQSEWI